MHGQVYKKGTFFSFQWGNVENKLLYIAEKKAAKKESYFTRKFALDTERGTEYQFEESFGEQLEGSSSPIICILNINNMTITTVQEFPEGCTPAQAIWAPDDSGMLHSAQLCSEFNPRNARPKRHDFKNEMSKNGNPSLVQLRRFCLVVKFSFESRNAPHSHESPPQASCSLATRTTRTSWDSPTTRTGIRNSIYTTWKAMRSARSAKPIRRSTRRVSVPMVPPLCTSRTKSEVRTDRVANS